MLKKRIVATLVVKDGIVVQSIGFNQYLPIGKPAIAVDFVNQWGIDEIILLDITAGERRCAPDYAMIRLASTHCRVPLTVGGGISNINHIKELMHCGADKVAINQSALNQPKFLAEAAHVYGDQCIVASIDAVHLGGDYRVYDYRQHIALDRSPQDFAKNLQRIGVGEILINSVDRDGSYRGFDLDLINGICGAVTVPVICCGGAGNATHFVEVFQGTNTSAAAAANFFHFTEHSVTTTKALVNKQIPIRHETHADYVGSNFDTSCRLLKKDDRELEKMLFVHIEKEVV